MAEQMNEHTVSIDELRDALSNAEKQIAALRQQQQALENELRGLLNASLTDEQRDAERQRIKAEYRELVGQQRVFEQWASRLRDVIDLHERRTVAPRAELRQALAALGAVDARLADLNRHAQETTAEREALLLRRDTTHASVDTVLVEMPERSQYTSPARVVQQIGTRTRWFSAEGVEVRQDGSPLEA